MIQEITSKVPMAETLALNQDILLSSKWVRVYFGGELIADSKNVILLRQKVGKIQNLVSFYPSKVDAIYLDGIKQA